MHPILHRTIKNIYNLAPFKPVLFKFLKKVWSPSERIYKHLHFKGIINVPIDDNHSFKMMHYGFQIENEIFWSGLKGGWEKQSTSLWIRLCAESNVIFDIGANTGIYSLIAKTVKPSSNVYAFEPVERVFEKLEANSRLNAYDINCFKLAVSDYDGEGVFFDSDSEHIYSVTLNKKLVPTSNIETRIKTVRLDTFIEKNNLSRIDLMKIDVESHEAEVLRGLKEYLSKFRPTLLIEILFDDVGTNVQEIVKDLGYLYFHIHEEKGPQLQQSLIPFSSNFNYLLCSKEIATQLDLIN